MEISEKQFDRDNLLINEIEKKAQPVDYRQIFKYSNIVFAADHSHGDSETPQHFIDNAQALAEAGLTHFAIEIDNIHNSGILTRLNMGEKVDLSKIYPGIYAEMLTALVNHGIKIVAIDTSDEDNKESKRDKRESDITNSVINLINTENANKILVFIGIRHIVKSFNPGGYPSARKRLFDMGINIPSVFYHLSSGGSTNRSFGIPSRFDLLVSQTKLAHENFMLDLRKRQDKIEIPYDTDADWLIHV